VNTTSTHSDTAPVARLARRLAVCAALAGLLAFSTALHAQEYYDFDSGTATGWLTSTGHPNTITFPTDALGGYAWRLQGTPKTSGSDTNARVVGYFTNRMYTNFWAAVDVVAWNTNQDCQQVVGILARANANALLGNPTFLPDGPNCVTFNVTLHDYRSYTGPTNNGPLGAAEQFTVWGLINPGGAGAILGSPVIYTEQNPNGFRWVPGHAYRLVLSCTNVIGDPHQLFTASMYDVNDLTAPLFTAMGYDTYLGNNVYIPPYGYAGVFTLKNNNGDYDTNVDVTFDNFYVGETAPVTAVVAPAIPHGKWGAPQVINRVPVSFKNFHPAASGITFNATTLTTTNNIITNAIKLYLNGVDVSAGLAITGPQTNASVAYYSLVTNTVYDASIVLQDALGRRTTNQWTFDTFSDAYLASSDVKTIEAEDYDFQGGQFIDDPPASGFYDYVPATDTYAGFVNYTPTGYVDSQGNNANGGTAPFDFFDHDSGANSGAKMYRHADGVGTQMGNWAYWESPDANTNYLYSWSFDTQRSKYSSLADGTVQEYDVMRTEGGEWLNYTRIFDGSKNYNVYLRTGCGLAQPVQLDQIVTNAPGATNTLGWFNVPSTGFNWLYRYTPLVTTNGALAVINLSQTNTVRLTMDSPQNDATKFGLSMNYMVFVPAVPQVYSCAQVASTNTAWTPEVNVLVDTGNKRLTVPLPQTGAARFYRIGDPKSGNAAVSITGFSRTGGNVVLSYQ
jgi:hypothetical protein